MKNVRICGLMFLASRKTNEKLENSRRRAAQQVEKAMAQIDNVLGDNNA